MRRVLAEIQRSHCKIFRFSDYVDKFDDFDHHRRARARGGDAGTVLSRKQTQVCVLEVEFKNNEQGTAQPSPIG